MEILAEWPPRAKGRGSGEGANQGVLGHAVGV